MQCIYTDHSINRSDRLGADAVLQIRVSVPDFWICDRAANSKQPSSWWLSPTGPKTYFSCSLDVTNGVKNK